MRRPGGGGGGLTARRAWIACAVAGALAFVASWLFGRVPGLRPCGPGGGLGAVLGFEFAANPADVAALFGTGPCRAALIAAQRTGLLLDGLWFIPAYTAFLTLAAWAGAARRRAWLVAALVVAGLSDEVEGLILWSILSDLPGTQGRIDALWAAVHLKFALLALGTFGIGWALRRTLRGWWRLAGFVVAGAGLAAMLELATGDVAAMMLGFSVGWITLLGVAIVGAVRSPLPART